VTDCMARPWRSVTSFEVIEKINAGYIEIVLAKLQWSKDEKA
jgi:hypothetical protein